MLTYCVAVYNITAPARTGMHTRRDVCMLTHPSFVLPDVEDSTMYMLEFVVTAVSELGQGPPSAVITANLTGKCS